MIGACVRLNAAQSALIFAAGEVPPKDIWNGDAPPVVALKTVVGWSESGLSVDREHLESLLSSGRKKAPVVPLVSFPTPAGTPWNEVRFVVTETTMRIGAKGKHRVYTFLEAGFEDKRKKNTPDRLWGLLRMFAGHAGVLPTSVVQGKERTNLKQYVSELRRRVSALVPGIDEEPIAHHNSEQCYRTAFQVASEDVPQFPTPAGASWADVSVSIEQHTTVRVAVSRVERFSTRSFTEDNARGSDILQWENAERKGTIVRAYELRALKLADDGNKPNRAGKALLAVLAGNGVVKRQADDKGMLELCGVLTKLTGIDGSPFEFAQYDEHWVAAFEVSEESMPPR